MDSSSAIQSSITLDWVSTEVKSATVLKLIEELGIIVTQNIIYLSEPGLLRYIFTIQYNTANEDKLQTIIDSINLIKYVPVSYTANIEGMDVSIYQEGLKEILLALFGQATSIDAEILTNPDTLILTPRTAEGTPLYVYKKLDLTEVIGYKLLSSDPLIWYYLESEQISVSLWKIKSWHNLAVLPMLNPIQRESSVLANINLLLHPPIDTWEVDTINFVKETAYFVASLRRAGYYAITEPNIDLVVELASRWQIKYWGITGGYHILQSDIYTEEWLIKALTEIKLGGLPKLSIAGQWNYYVDPTPRNLALLGYAAKKALIDQEDDLVISSNLLLTASFYKHEDYVKFSLLLEQYILLTPTYEAYRVANMATADKLIAASKLLYPSIDVKSVLIADLDYTYIVVDKPEQFSLDNIIAEANNIKIEPVSRNNILLSPIDFTYYASLENPYYTFSYNDINFLTISTEDPVEISKQLANIPLLNQWGTKIYSESGAEGVRRHHFRLSNSIIKELS